MICPDEILFTPATGDAELQGEKVFHVPFEYMLNEPSPPQSVQNIINPSAGVEIALR